MYNNQTVKNERFVPTQTVLDPNAEGKITQAQQLFDLILKGLIYEPLNKSFEYARTLMPTLLDNAQEQQVRIGRELSSKQLKANPENFYFDSKVLSRNHAEISLKANKFFVRDLGSSNGTYVNNVRLSNEGLMSPEVELKDGSILEFGADILDNKGKILYKKVIGKIQHIFDKVEIPKQVTLGRKGTIKASDRTIIKTQEGEEIDYVKLQNTLKEELDTINNTSIQLDNLNSLLATIQRDLTLTLSENNKLIKENDKLRTENKSYLKRIERIETQLEKTNAFLMLKQYRFDHKINEMRISTKTSKRNSLKLYDLSAETLARLESDGTSQD